MTSVRRMGSESLRLTSYTTLPHQIESARQAGAIREDCSRNKVDAPFSLHRLWRTGPRGDVKLCDTITAKQQHTEARKPGCSGTVGASVTTKRLWRGILLKDLV